MGPLTPLVNSAIIAVLIAAMTFVSTLYFTQRKRSEDTAALLAVDHARVLTRLSELESKLSLVNQAVVPISTAFQAILIKELTHKDTPEMDALMVKIGPPNVLTQAEIERLIELLKARTEDMGPLISHSERDAAFILPAVMARAKSEQAILLGAEDTKLKLISVATLIAVPVPVAADHMWAVNFTEGVSPDARQPAAVAPSKPRSGS